MSYRNPKQYIDTQSMQIQQNLQKNLANIGAQTVSNVSKVYEENRKKTEEIIKAADAATDKISQNIYQTQAKDPTIKMGNMYNVSKYVNSLMKMDPLKLTDSQRNTISSFKTLGTRMAGMLESTYAVNPSDVLAKKTSAPGGLNPFFNPGKTKIILASANIIDSDKTATFPIDDRGNIGFNVEFRDVDAKAGSKPFGTLNNPTPLGVDPVPNITESEEDSRKKAFDLFLLNDPFSPIYKDFEDKDGNIIEGEIATTTQGNGVTITGRRAVESRMRKITDTVYLQDSEYNTLDKAGKVAYYRNLDFKEGYKEFGKVEGSDVIDVTKVTDEDLKYMLQKRLDQNYEVMKLTYPQMKKALGDKGTPSEGSDIKMTYAQIKEVKTQKGRQKVFSEYVGKGTEGDRYIIPAKNNSSIQAIKKEVFNKDGSSEGEAWFLQQKSGSSFKDISQGYSNIKFIAEDLGYTTPKEDSGQITSENTVIYPDNVGAMTEEQQNAARLGKLPIKKKN